MEAYSWECQKLRTTLSEPSRQQLCISLMISQSSKKFSQSELAQEPPRAPGWLRITLVFAAFFIAASSPMLLYYFLVPLREGLLSESVLIKAGPYIVVSAVVCVTHLLFTFLLTRYVDRRGSVRETV